MLRVLSLGAGLQSSTLLLMSCRGELPRLDAAVFADTKAEPKKVYRHLEWLKGEAERAGVPVYTVSAGDLTADALAWMRNRVSDDGKRYASVPLFVLNPSGRQGRLRRQCTLQYKIQPTEQFILRELIGVKYRGRRPKDVAVELWFGITADEHGRAVPPGRYEAEDVEVGKDLFGDPVTVERKVWKPAPWKAHVYPFLDARLNPDRSAERLGPPYLGAPTWTRDDCRVWAAENYPGRTFPRSACYQCPFRSNAEWRDMRDNDPDDWTAAVAFDREARRHPAAGLEERKAKVRNPLAGQVYVHRQMVPLEMADLGGDGEAGGGCGALFGEAAGMCDV